MSYKLVKTADEVAQYLSGHSLLGLDIETSPKEQYRSDKRAALDSNKSEITGISLSVESGTGIYIPFRHKNYQNANVDEVFSYIKQNILLDENKIVVIHNAVFESAFFYALGVVMKCKVYDTMAAAQLTLKRGNQKKIAPALR